MKRCPKCNRTFPDENQKFCTFDGGLLLAHSIFDPNVTIRATASDMNVQTTESPEKDAPTSRDLPNLNETIAASAPTVVFPRDTGPTGTSTLSDLAPPAPPSMPPPANARPVAAVRSAPLLPPRKKKKSKLPWILAALLVLLLLGGAGAVGVFFLLIKPRLIEFTQRRSISAPPTTIEGTNTNTTTETKPVEEAKTESDTFVPPADALNFTNSKENLDGKLAEHYVDFSFYYPNS